MGAPVVLAHELPFHIGDAEFRPATREIVLGGQVSVIEPRVMQVLVALHRAEGAVVSKDDLQQCCWEDRIVGEDAINRVISRLRAVADKQAGGQFKIETITKVGYRLVTGRCGEQPSARQSGQRTLNRRDLLIAGSVLGAGALAGGVWIFEHSNEGSSEAKRLYAEAQSGLLQGTPDAISNAIAKLKRAIEISPGSAKMWGALALAYLDEADSAPADRWANSRARGLAAADRALAIDPADGDALSARVKAVPMFRNWIRREHVTSEALRRNPNHGVLNVLMADLYAAVGRSLDALRHLEVAGRSADFPHLYFKRIYVLWSLGRFDDAEALLSRGIALWPRHYAVWFARIYYLMFNGRAAESALLIQDEATRPLGIPDWNYAEIEQQAKAIASGNAKLVDDAVKMSAELAKRGTGFAQNAAVFASFVGHLDTAYRMSDALFFDRGLKMPDMYFSKEQGSFGRRRHTTWLFERPVASFRHDPRYSALTQELGLDDYWAQTNSRARVVA